MACQYANIPMASANHQDYESGSFCREGYVFRLANGTSPISASVSVLPGGPNSSCTCLAVDNCSITLTGREDASEGGSELVRILTLLDEAEVARLWLLW